MSEAKMYADYYGYPPQKEDESDESFKRRIVGALRDDSHLIEAHELHRGKRWDDPDGGDDVMTGVTGAMAQIMGDFDYGSKGDTQIGDDIAVGTVVENPRPEPNIEAMMLLASLLG